MQSLMDELIAPKGLSKVASSKVPVTGPKSPEECWAKKVEGFAS